MIRFIDLTRSYYAIDDDEPLPKGEYSRTCAFISTVTDRFLESDDGRHTFDSLDEIRESFANEQIEPLTGRPITAEGLIALIPPGFFDD